MPPRTSKSSQRKKTLSLAALALLILIVAGFLIFRNSPANRNPALKVKLPFVCDKCGEVTWLTAKELRDRARQSAAKEEEPIINCPSCDTGRLHSAVECPNCHEVFVVMRPEDRCPKCGTPYMQAWKSNYLKR